MHSGPNAQHGVHFYRELQSEWSTSLIPQQGGNEERKQREKLQPHFDTKKSEELFQAFTVLEVKVPLNFLIDNVRCRTVGALPRLRWT